MPHFAFKIVALRQNFENKSWARVWINAKVLKTEDLTVKLELE